MGINSAWWIAARAEGEGGEEDTPQAYSKAAVRYVEENTRERKRSYSRFMKIC